MPLPSFLKRPKPAGGASRSAEDSPAVEAARTRARRRLIGAVVLLGLGVVIFPIIFETTPRPISPAVPIELPKAERAEREVVLPAPPRAAPAVPKAPPVVAEAPADTAPPAEAAASTAASAATAPPPKPAPVAAAASRPAAVPAPPSPKPDDAQRAQALLEGSTGDTAARFVVQVGAYSDAGTLRETRQKVERLGLKTYTQVVDTDAGKRTRVRVGPFATREEADSAGAKLKSAGLPAAVLTL